MPQNGEGCDEAVKRTLCPTDRPDLKEIHMKKLHSFAFYAMVAPALTLGAGSVLAQQSTGQDVDRQQQNTQREMGAGQSDPQNAANRQRAGDQTRMQNRDYIGSIPANGMQASDLIGANVKTSGDEEVGSVGDLIIDQDGKVVAVIVGVGGFLGMGEKEVAISWDRVTRSGTGEEQELRIDSTRQELQSAPEFEPQDQE